MDDDDWENADVILSDKIKKNDEEEIVNLSSKTSSKPLSKAEAEKLRIKREQEDADQQLTNDLFGVSISGSSSSSKISSSDASKSATIGGSMEDKIFSLPLNTEHDHRAVGTALGKRLERENNPTKTKELCRELLRYACKILTEQEIAQVEEVAASIRNQKKKENDAKKPKKKEKPSINNFDDFDNLGSFKGSRAGGGRSKNIEDDFM